MNQNQVYHNAKTVYKKPSRCSLHEAALKYAERGIPVFPCEAGGKKPLVKWREKATTNPSRITALWNRYPEANIGIPTGEASGLLVLDEDRDGSLSELPGDLPQTTRVQSGSGGVHVYLRYPPGEDIRNSASKIADGLDVRGEGGYIIAPPSHTSGPYKTLVKVPPADTPAWLVEALRTPHRADDRKPSSVSRINTDISGPGIGEGRRNEALTRIAGRMHDGRSLEDLEGSLLAVNGARCIPPLPEAEVISIARSVSRYAPSRRGRPTATQEALEELATIEEAMAERNWPGLGGKTDRDVVIALIKEARKYGELIHAGVRVSISLRSLALAAAVSLPSVQKAVKRLREAKILRKDDAERSGRAAGAFVLLGCERATLIHKNKGGVLRNNGSCVQPLRAFTAPRLRWSAPVIVVRDVNAVNVEGAKAIRRDGNMVTYRVGTIRRLGKTSGAIMDHLEAAGGELTLDDLYAALYPEKDPSDRKRWRPRELHRRNLPRLEKAGIVVVRGDTVALVGEWLERLNEEREDKGEIEAYRRDLARYERERDQHRKDLGYDKKPEPPQTVPDGLISELERLPEAEIEHDPENRGAVSDSPGLEDTLEGSSTSDSAPEPEAGAVEESPELTDEDRLALAAIVAFEEKFGSDSYRWDQASAKELFYSMPGANWPDFEQHERIRYHYDRELPGVAA